jgi:hypothetical protein
VVNWSILALSIALGTLIVVLSLWLPRRRQPDPLPGPRVWPPDNEPPADETPTGQIPVQSPESSEVDTKAT